MDRHRNRFTVTSGGRTITEADLVFFSMLTADWAANHTDASYAERTPFGTRIAHAGLVLSIATGLLPVQRLPGVRGAFGMRRVQFVRPARLGDTVFMRLTSSEGQEEVGPLLDVDVDILNQYDELLIKSKASLLLDADATGLYSRM